MTMRLKERELAAVAASVAAGCKPCTDYHVRAAGEAKALEHEIRQAIDAALDVSENARAIMRAHALAHFGGGIDATTDKGDEVTRIGELMAIAAAVAANCTTSLAHHLAAARTLGVAESEIAEVAKLAAFVRGKAASHVDKMVAAGEAVRDDAA